MRTNLIDGLRWPVVKRPQPVPYLYPGAYGLAAVPCWACFRTDEPGKDKLRMAATADPRIAGGDLVKVCSDCSRALRAGLPVNPPTGDKLRRLLVDWARWDTNGEINDDTVQRMLQTLFPVLDPGIRACWWECLKHALVDVQEASGPGVDWGAIAPQDRDPDALQTDAEEKAVECIDALMAGAHTVRDGGAR